MDIFLNIFYAVSPVIITGAFGMAALAITVVKTQDKKIKELEQRIEQLEKE